MPLKDELCPAHFVHFLEMQAIPEMEQRTIKLRDSKGHLPSAPSTNQAEPPVGSIQAQIHPGLGRGHPVMLLYTHAVQLHVPPVLGGFAAQLTHPDGVHNALKPLFLLSAPAENEAAAFSEARPQGARPQAERQRPRLAEVYFCK